MEMKTTAQTKSIALPLVISIIAISFSAIIVKWSNAPAAILSMYRMIFAAALMLPFILPRKRISLDKAQRLVFLMYLRLLFRASLCVVVWLTETDDSGKLYHYYRPSADGVLIRRIPHFP